MSVTKDLGNYVLSGTLHVTLSPEEAKNIQWQERAVDEAIEKTTALMPEVTEQASRLVQQREDIGMEEDKLGQLERQNQDLKRMVARIKAARGPPGAMGVMGPRGLPGAPGPKGLTPKVPPPGPAGLRGVPGLPGIPGPMGFVGQRGPAGPVGPNGQAGKNGLNGPDGLPGQNGPLGPPGLMGPRGRRGQQG